MQFALHQKTSLLRGMNVEFALSDDLKVTAAVTKKVKGLKLVFKEMAELCARQAQALASGGQLVIAPVSLTPRDTLVAALRPQADTPVQRSSGMSNSGPPSHEVLRCDLEGACHMEEFATWGLVPMASLSMNGIPMDIGVFPICFPTNFECCFVCSSHGYSLLDVSDSRVRNPSRVRDIIGAWLYYLPICIISLGLTASMYQSRCGIVLIWRSCREVQVPSNGAGDVGRVADGMSAHGSNSIAPTCNFLPLAPDAPTKRVRRDLGRDTELPPPRKQKNPATAGATEAEIPVSRYCANIESRVPYASSYGGVVGHFSQG